MKLYDIPFSYGQLSGTKIMVTVPHDAKQIRVYSSKTEEGHQCGASYISNYNIKEDVKNIRRITFHIVEFDQEVDQYWVFLGILDYACLHIYYSE